MPTAKLGDVVLFTKDSASTASHLEVLAALVAACNTGGTLGLHVFDPAGAFFVGSCPGSAAPAPGHWHARPATSDGEVGDVVQFVQGRNGSTPSVVGVGVVERINPNGTRWLSVFHHEGKLTVPSARDEAAFTKSPILGELGFWRPRPATEEGIVGEVAHLHLREPELVHAALVLRSRPGNQLEVLGFDGGGGTFQGTFPPEADNAPRFWRQPENL
jgi:hypothetical protein